VNYLYTA